MFHTPFGKATECVTIARGVTLYLFDAGEMEQAIRISREVNETIPEEYRSKNGWYEEKDYQVLYLSFPQFFDKESVEETRRWYREHHPQLMEELHGPNVSVIPTRLASPVRYTEAWFKRHANDLVEIHAWDDTHSGVDNDMVLVEVAQGGDDDNESRYFMVPAVEYEEREEFGFVITNPNQYVEHDLVGNDEE